MGVRLETVTNPELEGTGRTPALGDFKVFDFETSKK